MAKRSEYGAYRNPMANGYIRVWCPGHPTAAKDGYALEHRKIAFDAGLLVDLRRIVHHKNGVKGDNRIENLEVKTQSNHVREHALEAGTVVNQHGTWPVIGDQTERNRQNYQRKKAKRTA